MLQLRRVTWWTRHDPRLPDLTDSEDEEEEERRREKKKGKQKKEAIEYSGFKYTFMKYVCGVDRNKPVKKMTKEEKIKMRMEISNISEDPKWKSFMTTHAVICAAIAVFIHAFWG